MTGLSVDWLGLARRFARGLYRDGFSYDRHAEGGKRDADFTLTSKSRMAAAGCFTNWELDSCPPGWAMFGQVYAFGRRLQPFGGAGKSKVLCG